MCLTAILIASLQVDLSAQPTADLEAFEKEVRPLLIEHCGKCHGAEKQKAGLRLDARQAILEGGDSGPAIVAGRPDESLLIEAVRQDGRPEDAPRGGSSPRTRSPPWSAGSPPGLPGPSTSAGRRSPQGGLGATLGVPAGRRSPPPAVRDAALVPQLRSTRSSWRGSRPTGLPPLARRPTAARLIRRRHVRPDRPAADARGGRGVRRRPRPGRLSRSSSTGCSPRRATASSGAGTGWTWPGTPTPRATSTPGRSGSSCTPGLPRLGREGVQRRPALRPVPPRSDRGRPGRARRPPALAAMGS